LEFFLEIEKGIEGMYAIKLNNLLRHSINEICRELKIIAVSPRH